MTMFKGIITPIVTPFHRDSNQSINREATHVLIDHLIGKGVAGLFILGSNGEFHVLDEDEKLAFAKDVIEYTAKRVPVYVGTGACSTKETVRLSKAMEALGADALSVITPYFIKPTDEELYEHFKTVAQSVRIPIVLYNIPKSTGVNLSAEVVGRLAQLETVKAIKDSSGDMDNLKGYIDACAGQEMYALVGSDSKISAGYALGATGAIAGTSNLITDVLVALDKALVEHDVPKAKQLQEDIDVLRDALKLGTVPSILKRSVELAGIAEAGPARYPVSDTTAATDEKIRTMLSYYHLI